MQSLQGNKNARACLIFTMNVWRFDFSVSLFSLSSSSLLQRVSAILLAQWVAGVISPQASVSAEKELQDQDVTAVLQDTNMAIRLFGPAFVSAT